MSDKKSADEEPKRKIAKRVVTAKHLYFVPKYNLSVEADDATDAVIKAQKQAEKQEDGDVE